MKRPAKLSALKNELVIRATAPVSSPKLIRKSLNNNPNDGKLLNAQIYKEIQEVSFDMPVGNSQRTIKILISFMNCKTIQLKPNK